MCIINELRNYDILKQKLTKHEFLMARDVCNDVSRAESRNINQKQMAAFYV